MKKRVAIPFPENSNLVCAQARGLLADAGFEVVCNELGRPLSRDEQKALIRDAYAVIAGVEPYDADMLAAAKELRVLVRFGVGTDNLDLDVLRGRGVRVGVIANHNAVAEFALTLALAALKNLIRYDACARRGGWDRYPMRELTNKTVGIVGFGRIGRRLAELLRGFDVRALAYDPCMDEAAAAALGVTPAPFERVLAESDVISLHLPHTPSTYHLINADALALMKKGAFLINTARGPIVDERALREALTNGRLCGAALDVYETEPLSADNPLIKLDSVVLAPHVAALTYETNYNGGLICARSIIAVQEGGEVLYPLW